MKTNEPTKDESPITLESQPLLSLLIPTLQNRTELFSKLLKEINNQIANLNAEGKVQVCSLSDNRQMSIGDKRNRLMAMATGKYIAFIDDDDTIHRDYLKHVLRALELDPDVVGLVGEITMQATGRGTIRRKFFHTIRNDRYYQSQRGYERPPNHLNPMRKSIAQMFEFVDKSHGEDTDWAMRICKSKALKSEVMVDNILYFYNFNPNKKY